MRAKWIFVVMSIGMIVIACSQSNDKALKSTNIKLPELKRFQNQYVITQSEVIKTLLNKLYWELYVTTEGKASAGTGFFIIDSITTYRFLEGEIFGPDEIKIWIQGKSGIHFEKISPLIDEFLKLNKKRKKVHKDWIPKKRFIVDFDSRFKKYFENNGGYWSKLYEENPLVKGIITLAIPAVDLRTGYAIAYVDYSFGVKAGAGFVFILKKIDGKIVELFRHRFWIS